MLGHAPLGSNSIGAASAPPPEDAGTIVSASGRCSGVSSVAGAAKFIVSSSGSCSGKSTVQGRSNYVSEGVDVNDRIVVNLVANPFIVSAVANPFIVELIPV